MKILEYARNFFYSLYCYVIAVIMYLLGFSNKTPFVLVKDEEDSLSEFTSCSNMRHGNTCTSDHMHVFNASEGEAKCDYRWDRILSTRQRAHTYAEAFPSLDKKLTFAR